MTANSPFSGSAKPLPSSLPGPKKAEESSAYHQRSFVRAVSHSRNSDNPWVDERYLPVGILGWAQSSREIQTVNLGHSRSESAAQITAFKRF